MPSFTSAESAIRQERRTGHRCLWCWERAQNRATAYLRTNGLTLWYRPNQHLQHKHLALKNRASKVLKIPLGG